MVNVFGSTENPGLESGEL